MAHPGFHQLAVDILDRGPIYRETLHASEGLLIEPWNALSSIVIALPAIYWAWRLRGQFKTYWFIVLCMPFLFLNGLGSTLFHATRSSNLLLLMDFLPAAIVSLMVSVFFWVRALHKWYFYLPIILLSIGLRFLIFSLVDPPLSINLSYLVAGLSFLIPIGVLVVRMKGKGLGLISSTLAAFGLALFFRETDAWNPPLLPMGTHFLWHIFTGIGGFLIGAYLYTLEKDRISE